MNRNTIEIYQGNNKGAFRVLFSVIRVPGRIAPDSRARSPGFDTRSGHILSFLLSLIQEGQMSVTGKSMCTKYWLTAKPAQEKCG